MKPQVLHRVTLQNFFIRQIDMGSNSITVSAVESWNKIQKQLKNVLLKDLPSNKIKTVVNNFYLKSY